MLNTCGSHGGGHRPRPWDFATVREIGRGSPYDRHTPQDPPEETWAGLFFLAKKRPTGADPVGFPHQHEGRWDESGSADYTDFGSHRGNFERAKASDNMRFVDTPRGAIRIAVALFPFGASYLFPRSLPGYWMGACGKWQTKAIPLTDARQSARSPTNPQCLGFGERRCHRPA